MIETTRLERSVNMVSSLAYLAYGYPHLHIDENMASTSVTSASYFFLCRELSCICMEYEAACTV